MRVTGPDGGVEREDMVAGLVGGWGWCRREVVLRVGEGWRRGAEGNAGQPGHAGLSLHRSAEYPEYEPIG
jgi:hypothetical protein